MNEFELMAAENMDILTNGIAALLSEEEIFLMRPPSQHLWRGGSAQQLRTL